MRLPTLYKKMFLLFLVVVSICCVTNQAAGSSTLSIVDSSADLVRIREQGMIYEYNISVTLHNEGSSPSDNITISIYDDDGAPIYRTYIFGPGETQTFLFPKYPLFGEEPFEVTFTYSPTDPLITPNDDNSGTDTLIIGEAADSSSTPGFEAAVSIVLIGIMFLLIRQSKKRKE